MPAYKVKTDFKFKKREVIQDHGWLRSLYSWWDSIWKDLYQIKKEKEINRRLHVNFALTVFVDLLSLPP